jgi:hypothetical protein
VGVRTFRFVIGCRKPALSDHGGELVLLGIIALGVCVLAGLAYYKGDPQAGAAWSVVLMAIVNSIKERWQTRSIDRMGQSLANAPPADPPAEGPGGKGA